MPYEKVKTELSQDRVNELAIVLAQKVGERSALEDEKSAALKGLNARLQTLRAEIDDLGAQINNRFFYEDVEVREENDDEKGQVKMFAVASGTLLKTRDMTIEEIESAKERLDAKAKNPELPFGRPADNALTSQDSAPSAPADTADGAVAEPPVPEPATGAPSSDDDCRDEAGAAPSGEDIAAVGNGDTEDEGEGDEDAVDQELAALSAEDEDEEPEGQEVM